MSLYTIADLHLSLSVDKPMDVFKGWENYVQRIERNWLATANEKDTIVIAGDISWGMNLEEAAEDFAFIHRLPGKKIILKGNHDYWFATKTKTEDFFQKSGFDSIQVLFNNAYLYNGHTICGTRGWVNETGETADKKIINRESNRLRLSLEAGKLFGKPPIVFLHYPPIFNDIQCDEIVAVLKEYQVSQVYYGHIHGASQKYAVNGEKDGIRYQLVACDYTDFNLVKVL